MNDDKNIEYSNLSLYLFISNIYIMPTTIAGGQRRLLFTGNVKTNLVNKYTSGAGVGAINVSSRRALKRRATSSAGTLNANGNLIPGKPCCSDPELERTPP